MTIPTGEEDVLSLSATDNGYEMQTVTAVDAAAAAAAAADGGVADGGGGGGGVVAAGTDNNPASSSSGSTTSSNEKAVVVGDVVTTKDLGGDNGGFGGGDSTALAVATVAIVSAETAAVAEEEAVKADNDDDNEKVEKNPWSKDFCGIPINYFSVGVIYGGSVSVLYPLLIIQHGVTSSFYAASSSLVTLFWSYKIFFGMLCDCFPIYGQKWKPYIIIGWLICAIMLAVLAGMGNDVSPTNLVVMLTFANFGYVAADVAADGMMVWMAHHESLVRRGKIQTLIYLMRSFGRIFINIVIIFAFSGPAVSCPGYESVPNVPCTTDETVTSRSKEYEELTNTTQSDEWCYQRCDAADFNFGMTVPQFAWLIAAINIVSMPSYVVLKEDKMQIRRTLTHVFTEFWVVMKRRAVWQIMLYTMISSITFNVYIAAKQNANYVWLGLTTAQNQILNIMEAIIFAVGLALVRQYGLNYSWRKMIWIGKLLVTFLNLLYLLVVFDVLRNPWFYMFTDVTDSFMSTLNFMAGVFAIVEVSEPGFEAITYALITTANNATIPLSTVISYQFMALFPSLNTQAGLAVDDETVRKQFALLLLIVEVIGLTSLFALPMLPRQKKETKELVAKGETSTFWAAFTLISATIFLIYSTLVTFMTVGAADTMGCYKILGGEGCSPNESSIPVYCLMAAGFLYCYGVNFYLTFWPCITGREKFSFGMFF